MTDNRKLGRAFVLGFLTYGLKFDDKSRLAIDHYLQSLADMEEELSELFGASDSRDISREIAEAACGAIKKDE